MNKTELQDIGRDILEMKIKLLENKRNEWEMGRYSHAEAYEEAIKEVCLLK